MIEKAQEAIYSVSCKDIGKRIDQFLVQKSANFSRARIQALIRDGFVTVNNRVVKCSYKVRAQDNIRMIIPAEKPLELKPEKVDFEIIYEDMDIVVINKPAGVVIHPAPGHYEGTLVHGLIYRCKDLSGIGGILRPGIVHRLDKDTSGVMLVAKNDNAHQRLSEQFKEHKIVKEYWALVYGPIKEDEGKIELPIARHPIKRKKMTISDSGKMAVTVWKKISEIGRFVLVSVYPITGRTHQIRVHFSHIGYPIVGDSVYSRKKWDHVSRQMLHARRIVFQHPNTKKKMEFCAPLPEDMKDLFIELNKKM